MSLRALRGRFRIVAFAGVICFLCMVIMEVFVLLWVCLSDFFPDFQNRNACIIFFAIVKQHENLKKKLKITSKCFKAYY